MSTMPNLFQSFKYFVSKNALIRFYIILNCLAETSQKPYPHMGQQLLKKRIRPPLPYSAISQRSVLCSPRLTCIFFFFFFFFFFCLFFFFVLFVCFFPIIYDRKLISGIILFHMNLVTGKPVFRVFDQVRLKPACSASEASWGLENSAITSRDIVLSRQ